MSADQTPLPPLELVTGLPSQFDQAVTDDFIDVNGHMNIEVYFRLGTWAPYLLLHQLGVDDDYIPQRQMSFFTVEHNVRYASELRLGERFSIHSAVLERTDKAVRGAGIVVDREHDRIACLLEVVWVHVSMTERRSVAIPDDIVEALDGAIADGAGLAPYVNRLTLRR